MWEGGRVALRSWMRWECDNVSQICLTESEVRSSSSESRHLAHLGPVGPSRPGGRGSPAAARSRHRVPPHAAGPSFRGLVGDPASDPSVPAELPVGAGFQLGRGYCSNTYCRCNARNHAACPATMCARRRQAACLSTARSADVRSEGPPRSVCEEPDEESGSPNKSSRRLSSFVHSGRMAWVRCLRRSCSSRRRNWRSSGPAGSEAPWGRAGVSAQASLRGISVR